jgi:hypothetical protein
MNTMERSLSIPDVDDAMGQRICEASHVYPGTAESNQSPAVCILIGIFAVEVEAVNIFTVQDWKSDSR